MERRYEWEHLTKPDVRNEASVKFHSAGLTATGIQHGDGYVARWQLDASEQWTTQRVVIAVDGDGWGRQLDLRRDPSGEWSAETATSGEQPPHLASPGIAPETDLQRALDCDLAQCPLTNTMPIRRLGLLDSQVPDTQLIMAWIDIPSLQVIASDQYYGSIDSSTVHYASGTRGVAVELSVDDDGVVLLYPDLARRV